MKSIFRKLTAAILLVCSLSSVVFTLTSCDMDEFLGKPIPFTVHYDDVTKDYEAKSGGSVKIDEYTKPGYYCTGFYDAPDGGEMYFKVNGYSTKNWQRDFPTDFYAQYKPISEFSQVYTREEKDEFMYWSGLNLRLDLDFQNALKSNPNATLIIVTRCLARENDDSDWLVYYKNENSFKEHGSDNKIIANHNAQQFYPSSNYSNVTMTHTVPVSKVLSTNCLALFYLRDNDGETGEVKNLHITITFGE